MATLSTNLDDPDAVPYFMWDEPITMRELHARLDSASEPERLRLLSKIMREARDTDVWRYTTPAAAWRDWPRISRHVGRRKAFWEYLLARWRTEGLI
jgi:hypothetical protein